MPLSASSPIRGAAGPASFDLLIVGAGPAGAHAALAAASLGISVGLIDEAPAAGGQVWRAPPAAFTPAVGARRSPDLADGMAVRERLRASSVTALFGRRVWNLRAGFEAHTVGPEGSEVFSAKAMLLAPGTVERIVPFAGSTLPGVIGLGAATALLKAQQTLPGRRTIVAGAGPLLAAVAYSIFKGGGNVAAIVDLNGPADWLRALGGMTGRPGLLWQGAKWLARIASERVPYYARHAMVAAEGQGRVARARIAPVDQDWHVSDGGTRVVIEADAIAVGHGLSPSTEMTRLLGAGHRFDAAFGEWVPVLDEAGRTTVEGLFVAGDAGGVAGAAAAAESGRQAALAAARYLDVLNDAAYSNLAGRHRRGFAAARRFGRAMTRLTRLRPGLVRVIPGDTIVCRCEDVSRAEIDAASADGAQSIGQIKAWTRCGMGPCQGRMCAETLGNLMMLNGVPRERFGQMVARPPLRPVAIEALAGEFTYDEIALPPSLPSS